MRFLQIAATMTLADLERKLSAAQRLSPDDALILFQHAPSDWLREQADAARKRLHADAVFYNRNIHFEPTNICVYACHFCAFARKPGATEADGAWDYTAQQLRETVAKYPVGTLTEVHITGGVHPDRGVEYGEELCRAVKEPRPEVHVKAFTAVEISFFARKSGLSIAQCLERLKAAGLDSLPGGGAEIFDPEVRRKIAGGKAPAHTWLEVHEAAHALGLRSNATMLYGHFEEHRHRVDHMLRLRDLQDRTNGFMSFIPLRYRNENNDMSHLEEATPEEDLRTFAVARLFLDNIPHLKAYWVMLGIPQAQAALDWGVDDLDGTVDDSTKIYSMAGAEEKSPTLSSDRICQLIREKGRAPVERDSWYRPRA